jgi:hypothetical protein
MTPQGQKLATRRFYIGLALFYAVIFLAGSVMFIAIAIFPPDDFPAGLVRWLIRIGSFMVGGICFTIFAFFVMQIYLHFAKKRAITFKFKLRDFWRLFS